MKKLSIGITVLSLIFTVGFSASAQKNTETRKIGLPKSKESNARTVIEKTPVKFGQIQAFSDGQGVWLEWQMAIEINNLGFTVKRANGKSEAGVTVNRGLVTGAYLEIGETNAKNRTYSYFDAGGDLNSTYTIETLSLSGDRSSSKRIGAKAVSDLKRFAGATSEQLRASAASANPTPVSEDNVLPVDLKAEVAQNAAQPDAARQLWVASQPGVKIGVRREGIYRVSRSELQTAGFNLNSQTALWQLYSNGIEQAINVAANGEYIEFYGRGIDTAEANTQIYYLVVGEANGKRFGTSFRRSTGGRVLAGNYTQSVTKKERFVYSSNVLNGDAENFFGSVINNSGASVSFNLTGVDFSSPTTGIDLMIQGLTTNQHETRVSLNGNLLGTISTSSRDLSSAHFDIPTSYLIEGANNLQLNTLLGSGDITLFDRIKVEYERTFKAEANALSFYTPNYRAVYIENFSSPNVRVFDITNTDSPSVFTGLTVEQNAGAYRVFLPSNRGRVLFAVEDSAVLSAATIGANKPSSLTTNNHNADLIVLTYKTWAAQAEDWAAYRRAQGLSVEVVDIDDVYDENSFGALDSLSIRRFLQYASANWQTAPKYVLLIGDATYDPKNYFGGGYNSFIPTRLVDTVYTEAGSDDALADFNDDGLIEIAIGRIPAKSGAYVTQQLGKVTAFEQSVAQQNGLTARGALFASDLPNGYDFESLSNRVRQNLPQGVSTTAVARAESDANTRLLAEMNSGKFLVNYSGHGTVADWADANFFGKTRAAQLSNQNLSIFTMLTCLNGYFINPNQSAAGDGLAEVLLTAQNGAVASWASSGLTTPDVQEIMATRFYQQIGAGNFTRLGDLVKDAKTEISGGRDVRLSWVLLGDPTLKVK